MGGIWKPQSADFFNILKSLTENDSANVKSF